MQGIYWINLKSVDWNKNECKNTWHIIVYEGTKSRVLKF